MTKVLVFGMTENPGGVESFLMNYYRNMDREKFQFGFLCNSHLPIAYEEEILETGGKTYHITARSDSFKKYRKELKDFFENEGKTYDRIWVNVSSLANIDYLKMAKKYGIPVRIIHSHNSTNMDSMLRGILHAWNVRFIQKYANRFFACSEGAAKWFYKKSLMPKVEYIHNAIDVKRMQFSLEKRKKVRESYQIAEDTYVLGNVGRLHFQKNQRFLLEVFAEVLKTGFNGVLMLVGQGEDEERLKETAKQLGISDRVIFAGVQSDMQGYLSAFDLFVFPSIFEGLSIALLEAQANGLPILSSNWLENGGSEVRILDHFTTLDLAYGVSGWKDQILEMKKNTTRTDFQMVFEKFTEHGYEIHTECEKLESVLG